MVRGRKGIHATYAGSFSAHIEGGKEQTPKVVHFQLRGNPWRNRIPDDRMQKRAPHGPASRLVVCRA